MEWDTWYPSHHPKHCLVSLACTQKVRWWYKRSVHALVNSAGPGTYDLWAPITVVF